MNSFAAFLLLWNSSEVLSSFQQPEPAAWFHGCV